MMAESLQQRFTVKQGSSGKTWLVWDGWLKQTAVLKGEELRDLSFSAAETLRDTLNADHSSSD
jgi:hypothetical protein